MKRYAVVIPTLDCPSTLWDLLGDLRDQSHMPSLVVVAEAPPKSSPSPCQELGGIPSVHLECEWASAAGQRNDGADETADISVDYLWFLDDDVRIPPDMAEKLVTALEHTGGLAIAGRMHGGGHPKPGRMLRWYYRLQAGYPHPHYGASLFGPGINTFPCYEAELDDLVQSDWLNSACLMVDRAAFAAEDGFPAFAGYSAFEDAHLTGRLAQRGPVYFHRQAEFQHIGPPSQGGPQTVAGARAFLRNQRIIARDILGTRGLRLEWKMTLHKLFVLLYLVRSRHPGWKARALGTLLG